jgi:hypothetical protein
VDSIGPESSDDLADSFDYGCVMGFWCGVFVAAVVVALFRGYAT